MISNAFLRLCDYLFVLRPLILVPAWSFFLIGAAQGRNSFFLNTALPPAGILLTLTAILIVAYLLNQIFDRDSDERNNKIFYLASGLFSERRLLVIAVAFFLIASVGFGRVDGAYRIPLVLALVISLIYSLPPIRLCARPFLDMAANAAGYGGIAVVLGYTTADVPVSEAVRMSAPYVLLVASTFLHTAILDFDGDKAVGKISTAVFIGRRPAAMLAAILHGVAIVAAAVGGSVPAVVITASLLPIAIYAAARIGHRTSNIVVQSNTIVVALAAAMAWPVFLVAVIPILLLSRFYYKRRFGIIYPGPSKNA